MKILYINIFYAPHNIGGAENSLKVIVEAMQRKGHDVVVLATSNKKGVHREIVNGIKVHRVGIKGWSWLGGYSEYSKLKKILWHVQDIYNFSMIHYVKEVIATEKPDIVCCHNIRGWSIAIWDVIKKAGLPIVQVLHDFYLICPKSMLFRNEKCCKKKRCIDCRIMRIIHRKKSKNIDAVVGVCQDILNRVVDAGYFEHSLKAAIHNIRIVPNITIRKINWEEKTSIIFGYIGTLTPNKGILWLIEQFKKVNSDNIFLKIAGKGKTSYENMLIKHSIGDSRISFLGYTNSENFYSQIDVLIIPSIWPEPLASVAIESCARHIPVITSGAGGLKEIIKDNYNGLYCDPTNPDTLSATMDRIINDRLLLEKLQNTAQKSILHFLDIERLTKEYENVYNQILMKRI